jgi:outer membrane lipoprotein
MLKVLLTLLLVLAFLAGCASGPPFQRNGDQATQPYPQEVVAAEVFPVGKSLIWGGEIIGIENLKDRTRMEILAYPLDSSLRPMRDEPSRGRFMVERLGYLESADYSPRRLVTVNGVLRRVVTGYVGKREYRYPLLEAEEIYLWPLPKPGLGWGSIHFGISISN